VLTHPLIFQKIGVFMGYELIEGWYDKYVPQKGIPPWGITSDPDSANFSKPYPGD
jgi:hypothetical protein